MPPLVLAVSAGITVLAAALAALLGAGAAAVLTITRESFDRRRREVAAAWVLHEDLWWMQSAIARSLTSLPAEGEQGDHCGPDQQSYNAAMTRAYRGRWWYADELPQPRTDAAGLGVIALATTRPRFRRPGRSWERVPGDPLRWQWISVALARVDQLRVEASRARASSAQPDVREDIRRVQLRAKEPERLLETYLRLEVARRALEPLINHYVARDGGWKVAGNVAEQTDVDTNALQGSLEEVNLADRLVGRRLHLRTAGTPPPHPASLGDAERWAAVALTYPPRQLTYDSYPWTERSPVMSHALSSPTG